MYKINKILVENTGSKIKSSYFVIILTYKFDSIYTSKSKRTTIFPVQCINTKR